MEQEKKLGVREFWGLSGYIMILPSTESSNTKSPAPSEKQPPTDTGTKEVTPSLRPEL